MGSLSKKKTNEYPFEKTQSVECTPLSEVPFISKLIDAVNQDARCESNVGKEATHAIVSVYSSAAASLRSHADDESYLDLVCPISTFSLGSCRDIVLSAKNRANEWQPRLNVKSQELEDGSLFVMKPGCQTYFLHRINEGDK